MGWPRLMMGVILLLNTQGIQAQELAANGTYAGNGTDPTTITTTTTTTATTITTPPTTAAATTVKSSNTGEDIIIEIGDLKFTFTQDDTDKNKFQLCLTNVPHRGLSDTCKCYSIGCPGGHCWKLLGYTPTDQVNRNLKVMGVVIAILAVMIIASTVGFARAHYARYTLPQPGPQEIKCEGHEPALALGKLDTLTHDKETTPPLPQRPQHTLKKNVEDDGYVRGNDIQTWIFQGLRNDNAFVGDARMSMCEKDC